MSQKSLKNAHKFQKNTPSSLVDYGYPSIVSVFSKVGNLDGAFLEVGTSWVA